MIYTCDCLKNLFFRFLASPYFFSLILILFLGCQAPQSKLSPSFQKLTELGYDPVEIQIGLEHSPNVWSLALPISWEKVEVTSHPLKAEWELLGAWKPESLVKKNSPHLYLLTRTAYSNLTLDLEMDSIQHSLGAKSRPTHSYGVTQNGLMGIHACHVEEDGFWQWRLLTPDPLLTKKVPLAAMKQPLLLVAIYETPEDLDDSTALLDAIYKSLQPIRPFRS